MCFKEPVCRFSVTNKGFNAAVGSLMLLTSFSHRTRTHRADHSVPNHSILVQSVPSHILFPNIPFCWNSFHFKPFHSVQTIPFLLQIVHFHILFPTFHFVAFQSVLTGWKCFNSGLNCSITTQL